MALVNIREVYPGVSLGIWDINESVEEMVERFPWTKSLVTEVEHFKSEEEARVLGGKGTFA